MNIIRVQVKQVAVELLAAHPAHLGQQRVLKNDLSKRNNNK